MMGEPMRPMLVEDLFAFRPVGDPQISPDGEWVVYLQVNIDDVDSNDSTMHLWKVSTSGEGEPLALTSGAFKHRHPRWSPDGKWILFESLRSGSNQLYVVSKDGGELKILTQMATEVGSGIWSRQGDKIAFVSAVWPEFSHLPFSEANEANRRKVEAIQERPVQAKVFDRLLFRHWDAYTEGKRMHLFVMDFRDGEAGEPKDVTPGDRDAYPTSTTFRQGADFAFSPDGTHLIFTAVPSKHEAWSTAHSLCRIPVTGGATEWEELKTAGAGAHGAPRFSPDGTKLAYRYQMRSGYEADQWKFDVLACHPDGSCSGSLPDPINQRELWEESAEELIWIDNENLLVAAQAQGRHTLFAWDNAAGAWKDPSLNITDPVPRSWGAFSWSIQAHCLAFLASAMDSPEEVMVVEFPMEAKQARDVTRVNAELVSSLDMARPESVQVEVEGADMQMWILHPSGFDPSKRWPLIYLVHGGPQSAWVDGWSYRWNAQVWAAQGYVVAMPNPRGSTGFGQAFVDGVCQDWGGKCYRDLLSGIAYLENRPYIDGARLAAAGGSFGGYMMNWFQGHTTKFTTLITHCGVYNHESMYATTDELWFEEWEHGGGKPLWEDREAYRKHSPHLFADRFQTPMLVIHNDLDFRVPVSQGIELFTTLQRRGIPSRMVNFPDEGHWVVSPANSRFWHQEIFNWLKQYCPPGPR